MKITTLLICLMMLMFYTSITAQEQTVKEFEANKTPLQASIIEGCGDEVQEFRPDLASSTDTVKCYHWNANDETWRLTYLFINTYDQLGRLTESVTKFRNTDTMDFSNYFRDVFTYYPNDSVKDALSSLWNPELDGGAWDNSRFDEYEYNSQDRLHYNMTYFSPYGSHDLNPGNRQYYFYNQYNLVDTLLTMYWNKNENQWFYSYRWRYYYDADQNPSETYQDWANNLTGEYLLNERVVYNRDDQTQTVDAVEQYYSSDEWVNYYRDHISLNNMGLPDSVLYQQWNPMEMMWDTTVMELWMYQYNASGRLTEFVSQSYYIMFVNNQRQLYAYDENDFMTESLSQQWDHNRQEWADIQNCFYPAPLFTPVFENNDNLADGLQMYPNPARDAVNLSYEVAEGFPVNLRIINVAGQQVLESKNHTGTIDVSGLRSGLYFLSLSQNGLIKTGKLLIE